MLGKSESTSQQTKPSENGASMEADKKDKTSSRTPPKYLYPNIEK
jgi:hypothetical protein